MQVFKKAARGREVDNLIFLQGKVSCPRYIKHYYENGRLILEMEKIQGKTLFDVIAGLNEHDSNIVAENIINELNKLRALKIDIDYVVEDALLGPLNFNNEKELNEIIASNISNVNLKEIVRKVLPTNSKFVLSHGDFHLSNIMIKEDLSIVLVDWESLNYLPEYWDPMKFLVLFHSDSKIPTYLVEKLNSNLTAILCYDDLVRRKF